MKKVIFAVICGLFLVGCAKNEPKPAKPQGASCGCAHHQKMMQGAMHEQMPAGCPAHAK